jgi:hypothetical protein
VEQQSLEQFEHRLASLLHDSQLDERAIEIAQKLRKTMELPQTSGEKRREERGSNPYLKIEKIQPVIRVPPAGHKAEALFQAKERPLEISCNE